MGIAAVGHDSTCSCLQPASVRMEFAETCTRRPMTSSMTSSIARGRNVDPRAKQQQKTAESESESNRAEPCCEFNAPARSRRCRASGGSGSRARRP